MVKEKSNSSIINKQPLLVSLDGKLFDITEFASRHPGGEKILQIAAGSDVGQFLRGEEELLGFIHEHSLAAYDILERYSLDQQFKNDPLIDGQEPILFRIGELGERYWTWIHQPYDGAVRMFKSNFLEQLTRTHGLHHKTPLDRDRLVFPPAAALIIVGFFYCFYRLLLPYPSSSWKSRSKQ
uniref:Cytochrome b5 heme-binding domain-containing protein n=1 Tax=Meloidogyne hapla TaxID=6305 RepID=A0A1I8BTW1_MELHA